MNKNHLLHGIGRHIDIIDKFAQRGIISQDYIKESNNHTFCYEAAFWNVKENISLKEYIKNYSGMIVNLNDKFYQIPYGKLDEFVERIKNIDHWMWTSESSMEIRFMPSLVRNNNQIGFILNTENEIAQRMKNNSVFNNLFNKDYALEFINEKNKEKYKKEGFNENFFQRADYIIFRLPSNCIEGVIVGRIVENNEEYLKIIKELYPNCYICNLDGVVIR